MNRTELNRVFEEMEPTSSQKQKMLENIINTKEIYSEKSLSKRMLRTKKVIKMAAAVVLVLFISGTTVYTAGLLDGSSMEPFMNHRSSNQSDYPILPPCSAGISVLSTLSDQVKESDLVVDATVVSILPDETHTYSPESGSTEAAINDKAGGADTFYVGSVIFSINEVIIGSAKAQITMCISPIALDCSPKFKKGDRMILMLVEAEDGSYYPTTLQQSYYYISEDKRVYPALLTKENKKDSGRKLGGFVKKIRECNKG